MSNGFQSRPKREPASASGASAATVRLVLGVVGPNAATPGARSTAHLDDAPTPREVSRRADRAVHYLVREVEGGERRLARPPPSNPQKGFKKPDLMGLPLKVLCERGGWQALDTRPDSR